MVQSSIGEGATRRIGGVGSIDRAKAKSAKRNDLRYLFKKRYFESLEFYKHFYDDISEYGNKENPSKVFYFIPGINGVPGQIRFILPSLYRRYGHDIYARCCFLPEFSATTPIWEKYTVENMDRKRATIVADLSALLSAYGDVTVVASSSGFYDFVHAYDALSDAAAVGRLKLVWGACAPDRFEPTRWEALFYPLNGFVHNGHRWVAFPNHNLLKVFNPEAATAFRWRHRAQRKSFFKVDLESRFVCFNLYWDYVSLGCFNEMMDHALRNARGPMDIEAHVLVAAKDGYWQGRSNDEIAAAIGRYVSPRSIIFKNTSHLWVVVPENVSELLDRLEDASSGS